MGCGCSGGAPGGGDSAGIFGVFQGEPDASAVPVAPRPILWGRVIAALLALLVVLLLLTEKRR